MRLDVTVYTYKCLVRGNWYLDSFAKLSAAGFDVIDCCANLCW